MLPAVFHWKRHIYFAMFSTLLWGVVYGPEGAIWAAAGSVFIVGLLWLISHFLGTRRVATRVNPNSDPRDGHHTY